MREIARETVERHTAAFGDVPILANALDVGGEYAYRIRGEDHMWRPGTVADLQHAVRGTDNGDAMSGRIPQKFRDYSKSINDQSEQLMTLRGMFRIRSAESMGRKPIPLEEVEPAVNIVKRFATGAMSFGSISREAHTTLAIAMNRIGGTVEHRRRRRGSRSLQAAAQWRLHALGDQAGRVGSLRRDGGIPRQFRHDADQDGARRQAR